MPPRRSRQSAPGCGRGHITPGAGFQFCIGAYSNAPDKSLPALFPWAGECQTGATSPGPGHARGARQVLSTLTWQWSATCGARSASKRRDGALLRCSRGPSGHVVIPGSGAAHQNAYSYENSCVGRGGAPRGQGAATAPIGRLRRPVAVFAPALGVAWGCGSGVAELCAACRFVMRSGRCSRLNLDDNFCSVHHGSHPLKAVAAKRDAGALLSGDRARIPVMRDVFEADQIASPTPLATSPELAHASDVDRLRAASVRRASDSPTAALGVRSGVFSPAVATLTGSPQPSPAAAAPWAPPAVGSARPRPPRPHRTLTDLSLIHI